MRKFLIGALAVVAIVLAILIAKTLLVTSKQIEVESVELISVDSKGASARLGELLRYPTISHQDPARFDSTAFEGLHGTLESSFPRVHARLQRERVSGYSLLYTWPGSDASLQPLLLLAHTDVVPIEPGTEGSWEHPPFAGVVANGTIWGRGALDDKSSLAAELEAAELLLAQGFRPKRTILFAFGDDEEVGGRGGALEIAKILEQRDLHPTLTLDEGGAVSEGLVPWVRGPVAGIGIAEKGYLSLELVATAEGGHSSTPPAATAVGALSRAIAKLEARQMPPSLEGPASKMLDYLAPEIDFIPRLVLANRWLFGGVLTRLLARKPTGNAMVRTTTAPTMLEGGIKENVLPSEVRAIINFRILPGDTMDSVVAHVREVIEDPAVEVRPAGRARKGPSPVSDVDGAAFEVIHRSIREVFPEVRVVPLLTLGGTDARHYVHLSDQAYRFAPLWVTNENLHSIHGTNERITVENYVQMVQFYAQLMRNAAG